MDVGSDEPVASASGDAGSVAVRDVGVAATSAVDQVRCWPATEDVATFAAAKICGSDIPGDEVASPPAEHTVLPRQEVLYSDAASVG